MLENDLRAVPGLQRHLCGCLEISQPATDERMPPPYSPFPSPSLIHGTHPRVAEAAFRELRELDAFCGQAVEMRRLDLLLSAAGQPRVVPGSLEPACFQAGLRFRLR
jgi:hypothetical protein